MAGTENISVPHPSLAPGTVYKGCQASMPGNSLGAELRFREASVDSLGARFIFLVR